MRKTILYLSGFMIISSLSVSCVSKKKFEELARAKREVDRNLLDLKRDKKQLEDQLQLAKDDFNTIRYKLTENNAVKDKTIDQLYTKLRSLESKQVELKSEYHNVTEPSWSYIFILRTCSKAHGYKSYDRIGNYSYLLHNHLFLLLVSDRTHEPDIPIVLGLYLWFYINI